MFRADRAVTLYKRWVLRDGASLDDVVGLVKERVTPHYRALAADVVLGLEAEGDDAVIAVQRWPGRDSLDQAMGGAGFQDWWEAYQPVLAAWDALLEFHSEWETEDLLG